MERGQTIAATRRAPLPPRACEAFDSWCLGPGECDHLERRFSGRDLDVQAVESPLLSERCGGTLRAGAGVGRWSSQISVRARRVAMAIDRPVAGSTETENARTTRRAWETPTLREIEVEPVTGNGAKVNFSTEVTITNGGHTVFGPS